MEIMSTVSPSLKMGLRLLGVWPDLPHSTFYLLIYMSSIAITQYFQYLYIFEHFRISELSNLVDGLPATLNYTLTFLKLTSLWMHRGVICQVLNAMDSDWRECVGVDRHFYVMKLKADISHFCSNAMLSFNAIAGVLYLLGEYAIRFLYLSENYNDTLRQLPIKIQLPFDMERSPTYELLLLILFVHVMLNVCTVAVINALILTLVLHVSGQIDIICQEFRIISKNISIYGSSTSTLGILIERHNKVISFSDDIENLFSFIALMQIVWNTLVICCLGFIIIISMHSNTSIVVLVKTIFAYFAIMIEAFIICFAGEYLCLKSKSIADAAYESSWCEIPPYQVKIILFMIMRSHRQLTISAGGITNLSLEAFTSMMKASVSYISVLHAMY